MVDKYRCVMMIIIGLIFGTVLVLSHDDSPNWNCPDCSCSCSSASKPIIKNKTSNIQAPHNDIDYSYNLNTKTLEIRNVIIKDFFGYSMQPAIFSGNKIILIEYTSPEQLEEGKIIYYVADTGVNRIHYIKGVYESWVVVEGYNLFIEENVKFDQIRYIMVGGLKT